MNTKTLRLLLERLHPQLADALEAAAGFAASRGNHEVHIEHLLLKLLERDSRLDLHQALAYFSVDQDRLWQGLVDNLARLRAGSLGKPAFGAPLLQWLERAALAAGLYYGSPSIRSLALLDALVELAPRLPGADGYAALDPVVLDELREHGLRICRGGAEDNQPAAGATASPSPGSQALDQFGVDFTAKAAAGEIDPVLGRNDEIRKLIDILGRRRKNNPILVGEPGVGKTAVVEGLAQRIRDGAVPESLRGVRLVALDMGLLRAGASVKGEFERRLKQVIDEARHASPPVILFIDEAHTLIGAGGEAGLGDAANLLKPALARGEMRTIAATTWSEYKRYFERDAALERRFQPLAVDEPDERRAVLMLSGLKERYQTHHGVLITDAAVAAAVSLSHRYINGRQLPDKAIDLLDTAAARVKLGQSAAPAAMDAEQETIDYLERRLQALSAEAAQGLAQDERLRLRLEAELADARGRLDALERRWLEERGLVAEIQAGREALADAPEGLARSQSRRAALALLQVQGTLVHPEVDAAAVATVVADWTGVPVGRMLRDQVQSVLELEERLAQRVVGQDGAISRIAETLRSAKTGLGSPEAPMGVFLLTGPSGVGKTETARALAEELFGGERSLISLNLSEYQEAHTVSQLKGSPPGYVGYGEGGVLTEAVRQRPYSVLLLDEVDKAHPEVMSLFYQVFDRGWMRDGEGRSIDFRNTVILMTSNLGAAEITARCQPQDSEAWQPPSDAELQELIRPSLLRRFAPAWLARVQVVPYRSLSAGDLRQIMLLKLDQVAERLMSAHGMELRTEEAVLDYLTGQCALADTGARQVNALIEQRLMPRITRSLLGFMAAQDMPDLLNLELDEEGRLSCVFLDREPEPESIAALAAQA